MKKLFILLALFPLLYLCSCGSSKKSGHSGDGSSVAVIVPRADAKSFQDELAGTWNITTMRRQQKAEVEALKDVSLTFNRSDLKFSGKAPCNRIMGTISLNGYSIRFNEVGGTKMACDNGDQENAFINLLQNRISAFTVDGDKLYLRDGISNIVFEGKRAQ